ncbi:MAG: RNA-binding S4 domain-containing protein [Bacteroidales bacterium]|nr:RNA-binding S4 domain-containing protein [Bacteroidales bacterium]
MDDEPLRIDKYLWAIRLFKTRSLATEACRSGRIKKEGVPVKASHEVKVGERYDLVIEQLHKQIEVKELIHNRVGAKLVNNFVIDLTPKEEYERIQMVRQYGYERRDRGAGRPTKRDRRNIEEFKYK